MKGRLVAYAVGLGLIGIGVVGILRNAWDTHPAAWAVWFGGAALLHDAVLVPIVLVIGFLTTRIPTEHRRSVVAALIVGGSVTLVALPVVLGYGRTPLNPSRLPLSYGRNLLVVLALIAVVVVIRAMLRRHRRRGRL